MMVALSKNEFIERNLKIKFKICNPSEIRNRFLKMLEAKVNIMRNSINFNLIHNRESLIGKDNEYLGI